MLKQLATDKRDFKIDTIHCDLAIAGGGIAGTCAAITAARAGLKVVLIQDRPVLGGNASSEVRLWVLGATAHMSNNNRWSREGGVIDEILVENMYRNPEGNALLFDVLLLEKAVEEPNITVMLNTAVMEAHKSSADRIDSLRAFCSQNSTMYDVHAPLFVDASGDGVVGFLSGTAFRMGAESSEEFGEKFAPTQEYGELLGHSIYFYSKDAGRPVKYIPPSFALDDITKVPRYRVFNAQSQGCRLWWLEYGGRLDTVHETETIKWKLWEVVYGVWNYIKNSGNFPDAENLTLEWVGHIPGKRESRRFEGDYMMRQQDIVEQRHHDDAVAFGGWSIDLHPADGVFSEKKGCNQWHARGMYQIPYRSLYSCNIKNLFLAGRCISASHVAFGSTRVMATCGHAAQAVAMAALICVRENAHPAEVTTKYIKDLQRELLRGGHHIPGFALEDDEDLAQQATVSASSQLQLSTMRSDGEKTVLKNSWAQMLPIPTGAAPRVSFLVDAAAPTTLQLQLRTSDRPDNHTPDVILATKDVELTASENQRVVADFDVAINEARYAFYCLMKNEDVSVHNSAARVTGILSVMHRGTQTPDGDIGVEAFEFWSPQRRPAGQNFALQIEPPLEVFAPQNILDGVQRPTDSTHAWVADFEDAQPMLTLQWPQLQQIGRIELFFDPDYDHPMESVLMGHPERAMPFCVKRYIIRDSAGEIIAQCDDNHQARNSVVLSNPVTTDRLSIECLESHSDAPAAIFEVRCYAS